MTFWTRKLSLNIIILNPMMTTARKWEEGARHPILTHCEVYELEWTGGSTRPEYYTNSYGFGAICAKSHEKIDQNG